MSTSGSLSCFCMNEANTQTEKPTNCRSNINKHHDQAPVPCQPWTPFVLFVQFIVSCNHFNVFLCNSCFSTQLDGILLQHKKCQLLLFELAKKGGLGLILVMTMLELPWQQQSSMCALCQHNYLSNWSCLYSMLAQPEKDVGCVKGTCSSQWEMQCTSTSFVFICVLLGECHCKKVQNTLWSSLLIALTKSAVLLSTSLPPSSCDVKLNFQTY